MANPRHVCSLEASGHQVGISADPFEWLAAQGSPSGYHDFRQLRPNSLLNNLEMEALVSLDGLLLW